MTGETIQLDQGGDMSEVVIADLIATHLGPVRAAGEAGMATLELDVARVALTADSFALDPLFFGNGDIGRLAVCRTVNELAAVGSIPRYITLSLLIEQGLPMTDLALVLDSVRDAAGETGVEVIAGRSRVMRGGTIDRLLLSAVGVGELGDAFDLRVPRVRPGDAVIATGWLGNHGVHVHLLRAGLEGERCVLSDCAPLDGLLWNVLEDYAACVRCVRVLTRGGLGAALNELADTAGVSIEVQEHRLPVQRETRLAAERLGVDPLYMASEGSLCMFVEGAAAFDVLELIRWQPQGRNAQIIGTVRERAASAVTMVSPGGGEAVVERLRGNHAGPV